MIEIEWDAGKNIVSDNVTREDATREAGYIHCPRCNQPGIYYETMITGSVCVECGYETADVIKKPIVRIIR